MMELTGAVLLLVPFAAGMHLPNILKECIPEHYVRNNYSANVNHSTLLEGLQDYSRYHANDTLIGQPVLCTHLEKLCIQYNMLYDGYGCVDSKFGDINLSSCHLLPVHGRTCELLCDGYVMAYDGQCYPKYVVRDVICGCDAEPTRHFIHGVECRCTPATPIHVEQPAEEGHCRIPDLRFPDNDRSRFYRNPFEDIQGFTTKVHSLKVSKPPPTFNCSAEQLRCFAQGKVWVAGLGAEVEAEADGCFQLLHRGPCPEEHVVALDAQAALKGQLVTTCTHVRGGCPTGHVRMVFDGNCHNKRDVEVLTRGKVVSNQFGILIDVPGITESLEFRPSKLAETNLNVPGRCAVDVQWFNSFRPQSLTRGIPVISDRFEVLSPNITRPNR